jgi:dihydroorotate dehydrogenase (NAD+) catalytic subunit
VNDALEFLIAGATTVGVGTALFYDPLVCKKINDGIAAYLAQHGMQSVRELIGTSSAHPPLEQDAVGRASARQKESG